MQGIILKLNKTEVSKLFDPQAVLVLVALSFYIHEEESWAFFLKPKGLNETVLFMLLWEGDRSYLVPYEDASTCVLQGDIYAFSRSSWC